MTGQVVGWMNPCSRAKFQNPASSEWLVFRARHDQQFTPNRAHTEKKSGQNCQQWIREQRTLHKTQSSFSWALPLGHTFTQVLNVILNCVCVCVCVCVCARPFRNSSVSELLHVYTPSSTLRSSSDTRVLEIQQYKRKTHGFRTFSCFGPHVWNSLPQDLRHCSTLSSFKAKLKTFLFSQYFHPN